MSDTNLGNNPGTPNLPATQPAPPTPRKIPKIDELYSDKDMAMRQNELNILLNQEPPVSWLKQHPIIKIKKNVNGVVQNMPLMYLPIQRVEWLLTCIFQEWKVKVKEVKQIANAVSVTITLKVRDPLTGKWIKNDGVGAMDIQTKAGASASDLASIVSAAIPKAVPAAKSYAIKDAAECLGKLFGKDLGRADEIGYQNLDNLLNNDETLNK